MERLCVITEAVEKLQVGKGAKRSAPPPQVAMAFNVRVTIRS